MTLNPYRLPRTALPNRYRIRLEPDLDSLTFTGTVAVDLTIQHETDTLVLNSAEIEIDHAVLGRGDHRIEVTAISYDQAMERATLRLAEPAPAGAYTLEMTHRGLINDQLRGLYKSVYRDSEGVEHVIATSQCQSTDARRIFPCWDEPDFKATFQTTMVIPEGLTGFSNTREVSRAPTADGRVELVFAETMKMSSYLLAFIVGPFEATEPVLVRGTPIRVIVPKGNLHLTETALENAVFCFEYLADYYGIPYPGDKLDHIAIPDFAAGAMENVGLITYRDPYLIIDGARATQAELQNSLDVVGHEIAHQWFGDLVTLRWWEGAWLNEAFASFMEYKATDAKKPEWKRWLGFANLEIPWAMGVDQLKTTRPIEFEVNAPSEVDEMFDAITYGKGSAVLRMIEQFIGEEAFRNGVGNYLRKHAYGNTVTADLWESLDQASEWPVGKIMDTWVYQAGFPQIEVTSVPGGVKLSQRRFLAIPDESDTTTWKIPIQIRGVAAGRVFTDKVLLEEDELMVPVEGELAFLVANAGGHGFYRTSYDSGLFRLLLDNLADLDDIERYALVSDTWALVRSSQVPASSFLDLVGLFKEETEPAIWSAVLGGLGALEHHAMAETARPLFEAFVRGLVGPALTRLGWTPAEGESDLTRKLRGDLIGAMGRLGNDPATLSQARTVAASVLAGDAVEPEVAIASLGLYAHHGDADAYSTLWRAYQEASTPLEKNRFLRAMASVATPDCAVSTVDKIVEGEIRTQDGFWVFARLLTSRTGPVAWKRARSRWDGVIAAMPGMTRRRVVEGISALSQPEVAADVKAFFAEHPIPEAAKALAQNLELLDANVLLRARETPVVESYFQAGASGPRLDT